MSEQVTQKISIFFLWAFLDDKKAIEAASYSYKIYSSNNYNSSEINWPELVRAIHLGWSLKSVGFIRTKSKISSQAGWVLPYNTDVNPWKFFIKQSTPDELESVILSKIIKIEDSHIAAGLRLSEGTVRYRVGHGLKKLGTILEKYDPSKVVRSFHV